MTEYACFVLKWIGGRLFFCLHGFGILFKTKAAGNVAII